MNMLRLVAEAPGATDPFIMRVNSDVGLRSTSHDAFLIDVVDTAAIYDWPSGHVTLQAAPAEIDGDVLLVIPKRKIAHRLIRANSHHNTLLVTEQCDQLCVMCSQPPKTHHYDLFNLFESASLLAPAGAEIGISGGEPTLYKQQLFSLMENVLRARPDISFHVLTNAQHFVEGDLQALRSLGGGRVLWGVPLYSTDASAHDAIVGKDGAYHRLLESLSILCRAGASIELRTVLLSSNFHNLPSLAKFISVHAPFATRWAIMQLENIGFARRDWDKLFVDSSSDFDAIATALDIARARGVAALLFNFPLCTVPEPYRAHAPSTISDWKRRYLTVCDGCSLRASCGGFFTWYPEHRGFRQVSPI